MCCCSKKDGKDVVISRVLVAPEAGSKGRAVSIGYPNIWAGKVRGWGGLGWGGGVERI
jgi:hypothetical protein